MTAKSRLISDSDKRRTSRRTASGQFYIVLFRKPMGITANASDNNNLKCQFILNLLSLAVTPFVFNSFGRKEKMENLDDEKLFISYYHE